MSKSANILFDDMFNVTTVDGNKYERGQLEVFLIRNYHLLTLLDHRSRHLILVWTSYFIPNPLPVEVSRLSAKSTNFGMDLSLDFNHELYPLRPSDTITLVLASTLQLGAASRTGDGEDKADRETWRPNVGPSKGLDADYDYVMYGKIYKFDEGAGERVYVFFVKRFSP
jgi:hypothetical protein